MEERVEKRSGAYAHKEAKSVLVSLIATLALYILTVNQDAHTANVSLLIYIVLSGIICFFVAIDCAEKDPSSVAFFSRVSALLAVAALVVNHFAFQNPILTIAGVVGLLFSFLPQYFAKAVKVG